MRTYLKRYVTGCISLALLSIALWGCNLEGEQEPRMSLFIGVDISGSFINSGHYDESLDFLARYIYAHLNGLGELEEPKELYVSSIGGAKPGEPKSFHPIQTFEHLEVDEVREKLDEMFPKDKTNPFTDFNAFFEQVAQTMRNKNLVLRPVSVVMISDGIPDSPDVKAGEGETVYRNVELGPLEKLSRNISIRLLYTTPTVGKSWQTEIPRRRVKIWTQNADVMTSWNDSTMYRPDSALATQERWLDWTKDNVDFGVRARRID